MLIGVRPAYGRDYRSAQEAIDDFVDGKDFIHNKSGQYCNIADCKQMAADGVIISFDKGSRKAIVYTKKGET